ncbi:MAG TPA: site-specific integrase [Pseudonocardiaceae bacterium]|nr:site-specific integrase [Pseudonocardiaceae bacterium]
MAKKRGRRRFGWVRKLPSGRHQASYLGPDGRRHVAPQTFDSETSADRWLVQIEGAILRREWFDPERARVPLREYAESWIEQRPGLRPSTKALYRRLLDRYISPKIGSAHLSAIDTPMVRQWRSDLLRAGVSESMAAKAYRLLRAVLMTATVEDKMIPGNPCQIRGAGVENAEERPVLSVAEVFDLADRMKHPRYRALILLSVFGTLRWGEVSALRRRDLAPDGSWVRVAGALVELRGQGLVYGPPKAKASLRTNALPEAIRPVITEHLAKYVEKGPDAWVFTGDRGNPIRSGNRNLLTGWKEATTAIGRPGLHFHDLRHTGNTLAAQTYVSTKDLMARMGQDSPRAALIYQHASRQIDQTIATKLSALIEGNNKTIKDPDEDGDDGASGVLVPAR